MSGFGSAGPVDAAIFALVSAFRDGSTIVEKVKERRQRKGKPVPNEQLQKALRSGAEEIQSKRHEYIEELGQAFASDGKSGQQPQQNRKANETRVAAQTASKLKDITLKLQDVIIKQLAEAFEDDDMNDFRPANRTIVSARLEAANVLNNLHIRLLGGPDQALPQEEQEPTFIGTHSRTAPQQMIERVPTFDTANAFNTMNTGVVSSTLMPKAPEQHVARIHPVVQTKEKRSGMKKFFKRTSTGSPNEQQLQSPPLSDRSSPNHDAQSQRHDMFVQNAPHSPLGPAELPSPVPTRNSVISYFGYTNPDTPVIPISEASKYGGLCKSAYHAQNYNFKEAMKPSMRDYEWMYHCRKCKYRLMADSSQRGDPHFDDRIQTSSSEIRFRCLFLWKSHVETKNTSERNYKCLICLLAKGESSIYASEDKLFSHLTRHDRQSVGSVTVAGPVEITPTGIIGASMQSFDLYFPIDIKRRESTRSFMLPDSVAAGNNNPGYGLGMHQTHELDGGQRTHQRMNSDYTQIPPNANQYTNTRPPVPFDVSWRPEGTRFAELDATNVR